jgi:hypothetical protein
VFHRLRNDALRDTESLRTQRPRIAPSSAGLAINF